LNSKGVNTNFPKFHGLLLSSVFSYSPNQSIEPSPISKLLAEIVISVRQLVGPLLFSPRILQILMYRGSGCGHDLNCFYFLIGSFILCVHRVESRRRPLWNATRAIGAADYSCGMTVMKAGSETGAELRLPEHNLHRSFLRSSRAHPSKRHFLLLNFPLWLLRLFPAATAFSDAKTRQHMGPTPEIRERENLHAKMRSRQAICTLDGADSRWIRVAARARAGVDVQTMDGGPHRKQSNAFQHANLD
jgi:hypothetical protein